MTDAPPARARQVPEKPSLDGLEARWDGVWEEQGTYRFDRTATREQIFSIDTPPPTVSGSLHMGSVFGYVQTDTLARYHRMRGDVVFYPMGWDDNGVPTERRVENVFGVLCDPALHHVDGYEPPAQPAKRRADYERISRTNFIELCDRLTAEDEKVFEAVWRRVGLSVDWTQTYATVDDHSRRVSQRAFLRNLARGEAYQADAPALWDTTFQMAVSQAELEDRERPGAYHTLTFHRSDGGGDVRIATTRPELVVSCVALVAHPDDERYQPLFGSTVTTPVFGVEVPVVAHGLAEPDKGTGAAMICTFGDITDVTWWRELALPARAVIGRDGRLQAEAPEWLPSDDARARYARLAGLYPKQAQKAMVELLRETGELVGEPEAITHPVKFYEKGEEPLEIVQSRQWYIVNGGRDLELRAALVARGDELAWHPGFMQTRYTNWIEGLTGDWLISRQRYFGVAIPLWYPLDDDGEPLYDQVIVPDEASLPVDPASECPPGYTEDQRGKPGGFVGDPDIMDTWATSSLTPQIACGWEDDPDLFERTFPMDLRPQGPEIIRTWLFSTVVRSHLEHGTVPWANTTINGWILDPDRKKMSKSKGNVVTPSEVLDRHGSDAVRYWAACARPGTDTAIDEAQMKVGRRLAIKVLNASRFALGLGEGPLPAGATATEPLDRSLLARLATLVDDATRAFDGYDYARALQRTEELFWSFCDDHLELVKGRAYGGGPGADSARATLEMSLSVLLRLFAPFLPFVTEEVWSWWQEGSIHRAPWPEADEVRALAADGDPALGVVVAEVLSGVRKAKSDAKRSMRTDVERLVVRDTAERIAAVEAGRADLVQAASAAELVTEVVDDPAAATIDVTLAPPPPADG